MHRMSIQENILDKYSGPLTHDDRGYTLAPSSGQSRGLGKLGRQGGHLLDSKITTGDLARAYLQPHYGNGVFGNVYLSVGRQ